MRVEPTPGTTLDDGAERVSFAYDHVGRRVWKQVETYAAGVWNVTQRRKFVWQDWLMLAELDETSAVVRQYTWGLDLGGTAVSAVAAGYGAPALQGAGGVDGAPALQRAGGVGCLPDGRGRPLGAGPVAG